MAIRSWIFPETDTCLAKEGIKAVNNLDSLLLSSNQEESRNEV